MKTNSGLQKGSKTNTGSGERAIQKANIPVSDNRMAISQQFKDKSLTSKGRGFKKHVLSCFPALLQPGH